VTRRRAAIAPVAAELAARPALPVWNSIDAFYAAEPRGKAAMLVREPGGEGPREERAYRAACAEHLSITCRLAPPPWVEKPCYVLDAAVYPQNLGRAFETICIAESPISFRRRFIFAQAQPLRRKGGP